jgi:DNA-binding GntR family transcriptional regulator
VDFKSKNDYIYESIKDDIVYGKYTEGERLIISDLAKQYNVSIVPIREVINRLLQDGLVEISANVGARVTAYDREKHSEMVFVRTELECIAIRLAIETADDVLISNLEEIIVQMENCIKNNDLFQYGILNRKFHLTIYEANPNKFLYETILSIWNRTELSRRIFYWSLERDAASLSEHKEILAAIKAKDAEKAVELFLIQKHNATLLINENDELWGKHRLE